PKFMVLELVVLVVGVLIFRGLALRIASGQAPRGAFWHFWESIALYLRDELVRPLIGDDSAHGHGDGHGEAAQSAGHHDVAHGNHVPHAGHPADRFLPFVW